MLLRAAVTAFVLFALVWGDRVYAQTPIPTPSPWLVDRSDSALVIAWTPYSDYVYEIRWRVTDEQDWAATETAGPDGYTIKSLTPSTSYDIQVRGRRPRLNNAGDWTDWSSSLVLSTLGAPTPTPAAYRLPELPHVLATDTVRGYVYPNGDTLILARYFVSRPPGDNPPPVLELVSWRVTPPSDSHAWNHATVISPVTIPDTPLGYGEGLIATRCRCYAGFSFTEADVASEQGKTWRLSQQLNPARIPDSTWSVEEPFGMTFMLTGDPSPAEAAVSRILESVDARQGTRLVADGYVTPLGDDYLEAYVSGIRFLLPGIYYGVGQTLSVPLSDASESAEAQPIGGTIITQGFESAESLTGVPPSMVGAMIFGGLALAAAVLAGRLAPVPGPGIVAAVLVLLAGAVMGWVPMWIVIAMALTAGFVIVWLMFLKKGG